MNSVPNVLRRGTIEWHFWHVTAYWSEKSGIAEAGPVDRAIRAPVTNGKRAYGRALCLGMPHEVIRYA
jgi:hypothetical protein